MGKKKNKSENKNKINKKKQNHQDRNREVSALFFILAAFIVAFLCVVPQNAGIIGKAFEKIFVDGLFGSATYIIPFILLWYFVIYIKKSIELKGRMDFVWAVLSVLFASLVFEAVSELFTVAQVGGAWVGRTFYPFFLQLFGNVFGAIVVLILFLFAVTRLLRISVSKFLYNSLKNLRDDMRKRKEEKEALKAKEPNINMFDKKPESSVPEIKKFEPVKPNIVHKNRKEEPVKTELAAEAVKPEVKLDSKSFDYKFPSPSLLRADETKSFHTDKDELLRRAELLRSTLSDFGISAEVKDIIPGPVVTRYDLILAPGIKIQSVTNITENISLTMRTPSIRVVPIPEKAAVGVEVPNPDSVIVGLRGIVEHPSFVNSKSILTLALGKTTDGEGYVADLASMPHLLIAGATGSGKSVGIHTIILSILFRARPDEVKFMIIDPKRVEMPMYKDLPHLYNPSTSAADADIITNPREAASSLKKLVAVMESRYTKFAAATVRNIDEYNAKMAETGGEKEFFIIVVIDELADLMLVAKKEIEDSIQRLAQMARAVGIHLLLATQRPSVNVITGIIKANFPARLSFQTTSAIDSRVILDMIGAENLMGKGDMLFLPPGEARPVRLQGAFVSLKEAQKVINFINEQNFPRIYEPLAVAVEASAGFNAAEEKSMKDLVPALMLINERKRVSQDLLKANFGSSARATNILSILEMKGFITKPEGTNKWQINFDQIDDYLKNNQ